MPAGARSVPLRRACQHGGVTATIRAASAIGCALALMGTGACSSGDRSVPTMVVAWPPDEAVAGELLGDPAPDAAAAPEQTATADGSPLDAVDVAALDRSRTRTAEDRAAVRDLVEAAGLGETGDLTVEVESAGDATVLVLDWSRVSPAVAQDWPYVVEDCGALLLATIDDLDEIHFHRSDAEVADGYLDRAIADVLAGGPVDEIGASRVGLEDLLDRLEP